MSETKIKICGLSRLCDAAYANRALPDFAGFVFYEKSRRAVTDSQARALRAVIRMPIRTVGVFVNAPVKRILPLGREGTLDIVQLHGSEDEDYIDRLRDALPRTEIWKAFPVRTEADLTVAARSTADRVLLDNGGGTGERFDWLLLTDFPRPFILAGGLTPQNIPDAIAQFHPYALDLSSGVEVGGFKDEKLMCEAVAAARRQ